MMNNTRKLYTSISFKLIGVGLIFLCLLTPDILFAQETDTTRQEVDLDRKPQDINLRGQFDRSMSGGVMTNMGTYHVPSGNQYYDRPFKGQYYLDKAVEAYRKEIEEKMGGSWYWNFLKTVSPYIRLQLGAFQTGDLPIVGRDNPLWESYKSDEKRQ